MSDKAFNTMDPIFETMGLLFVSYNREEVKNEIKKELSDLGFDGDKFYGQHLKIFDRYSKAFQKNRVETTEDAFFFGEKDSNYFRILLILFVENRELLRSVKEQTKDRINAQIIHTCKSVFDKEDKEECLDSLEDIILFLDGCGLEADAKWKMLRIMQNPQKYLELLVKIVDANQGAFHEAVSEISNPLEKILSNYALMVTSSNDKKFYEVRNTIAPNSVVYPTLIFPVSQMLFEKSCYYGLISERIVKSEKLRSNSNEFLLLKLKALSDSSKLGIIASLKISPKYNLEIAQQLGLTAATMSHHMSVLLNCGLVGVEKREGKVYYHLEKENLQNLVRELEKVLL